MVIGSVDAAESRNLVNLKCSESSHPDEKYINMFILNEAGGHLHQLNCQWW